VLNSTLNHAIHHDPVTHFEAFFYQNAQTADQIPEQILSTQSNGDTEQAQASQNRTYLYAPNLQDCGEAQKQTPQRIPVMSQVSISAVNTPSNRRNIPLKGLIML